VEIRAWVGVDDVAGGILHGLNFAGFIVANFIGDAEPLGDGREPGDGVLGQGDMVQDRDGEGDVEGPLGNIGQRSFVGDAKIEIESATTSLNGGAVQIHANQLRFGKSLPEQVQDATGSATKLEDGRSLQGGNQSREHVGVNRWRTVVEERLNRGLAIELLDTFHVLFKKSRRDIDEWNHGCPHSRNPVESFAFRYVC
jgi:hypothetical protein